MEFTQRMLQLGRRFEELGERLATASPQELAALKAEAMSLTLMMRSLSESESAVARGIRPARRPELLPRSSGH
jgi:hypothetical protein